MANTKADWKKGKLHFHNAPMFTAAARTTSVVSATGAEATAGKVAVSARMFAGTWSTKGTMHFRGYVGGVASASSAGLMAKLRWGSTLILMVSLNSSIGTKVKSTKVPFHCEFNGRIVNHTTLGQIAAQGETHTAWQSGVLNLYDGTTGGGAQFVSSDLNLQSSASTGLNIQLIADTTRGGAAGAKTGFSVNTAYIQFFD